VNLVPTAEQNELTDIAASFARSSFPISSLHSESQVPAADRPGWPAAARLGLFGLAVPDSSGGLGARSADEVLVTHALGSLLAPPSLTATLLAAHAAHSCESPVLRPLMNGGHVVGMGCPVDPDGLQIDQTRVSGQAVVMRTRDCDAVLLTVGSRFALIDADSLPACSFQGMDGSVDVSVLDLHRVDLIFSGDDERLAARRVLLLSALLGGIAESAASMSVSQAQQRQQFGRPIGAFQAIKHRCADMATSTEVARAATSYASVLFDEEEPTAWATALSALHVASEAALTNARLNIQNHGGMGFTMDCDAHLFVRRSHVLIEMAGGRSDVLAGLLSAPSPLDA
jgi:alkylation response protein AidB-like acyl-CoA dehydrogenase